MPNIRIDREVYQLLQRRAMAFVDTPNDVLRRLLNLDQDESRTKDALAKAGASGGRPTHHRVTPHKRSSRRKLAPRAPAGTLLPEQDYIAPILSLLSERGGTAPAREIIDAVGKKLENRLTPTDKEKNSSGVIRWQNRAQFVRLKLVEEGLLAKNSPRGIWALTDAARARLGHGREAIKIG